MFSPPQNVKPLSYAPLSKKNFLSIANKPPAIVGDLKKDSIYEVYNKFSMGSSRKKNRPTPVEKAQPFVIYPLVIPTENTTN